MLFNLKCYFLQFAFQTPKYELYNDRGDQKS